MALNVQLSTSAAKYLSALDKTTRRRIIAKLEVLAEHPLDLHYSYPLVGSSKRSSRVGNYRILFELDDKNLIVAAIGPRGQVYRKVN